MGFSAAHIFTPVLTATVKAVLLIVVRSLIIEIQYGHTNSPPCQNGAFTAAHPWSQTLPYIAGFPAQ